MNGICVLSALRRTAEVLAAVWGIVAFLYYWDPSRVLVKRLIATDQYQYETIDPRYLDVPVDSLITTRSPEGVIATRRGLIAAIWGNDGFPAGRRPDTVTRDVTPAADRSACPGGKNAIYFSSLECKAYLYRSVSALDRIEKLQIPVGRDYRATVGHFIPKQPNGGLALYQHGYAGTYNEQHRNIIRLLERGYGVLAFNLHGYGDNVDWIKGGPYPQTPRQAGRWILEPVIAALNYVAVDYDPARISMIGFSAGGWATAMTAAIDPRIRASYIVASPFPVEFRTGPTDGPDITRIDEVLAAAGYLDIFVAGAAGDTHGPRQQLQIYNRFDRCCWNNLTATLYRLPVAEAVATLGGTFDVLIDETHARHKVSGWAMQKILAALEDAAP